MDIPNQPVVIDNGSGAIKAGFAGEDKPRVIFPNYVGQPKYSRVLPGQHIKESYVGSEAQKYRGLLALRYPMEHGIITNWSDMQQIWEYIYSQNQLNCKYSDHPVLLSEAPLNPIANREKAIEIFFETFNVPAIHIQMQAVLSLYAAGRTTGVVLDSGDGVTHCVPVYEGFAIEPAIQRIDVAGRDVTRYLNLLLRKEGHIFHRTSEFEIVRDIKEKVCVVSPSSHLTATSIVSGPVGTTVNKKVKEHKVYKLPDDSEIEIGAAYYQAPEILFRPELMGYEYNSVSACILNAIRASDIELRKELFSNILLSGGSTMFQGFGERLVNEVKKGAPSDVKVRVSAPQDRLTSTWTGGSILATLDTFHKIMRPNQQRNL